MDEAQELKDTIESMIEDKELYKYKEVIEASTDEELTLVNLRALEEHEELKESFLSLLDTTIKVEDASEKKKLEKLREYIESSEEYVDFYFGIGPMKDQDTGQEVLCLKFSKPDALDEYSEAEPQDALYELVNERM